MVFKTGAISASLLGLALSSFQPYTVTAQTLPASAAIGAGPGTRLAAPFARNAAARDVADPADPDTVLVQPSFQLDQINTVRLFTRTCDCLVRQSDDDLVRFVARALQAFFMQELLQLCAAVLWYSTRVLQK